MLSSLSFPFQSRYPYSPPLEDRRGLRVKGLWRSSEYCCICAQRLIRNTRARADKAELFFCQSKRHRNSHGRHAKPFRQGPQLLPFWSVRSSSRISPGNGLRYVRINWAPGVSTIHPTYLQLKMKYFKRQTTILICKTNFLREIN